MKVYDYEKLIKLLNADSRYFVINGDDIDELYSREETYDIEFIDYFEGKEFLYHNKILNRYEEIFNGASIYKWITYEDKIKDRVSKGEKLIFVNSQNKVTFEQSIMTYKHLFDYVGQSFKVNGQIINNQTKVFSQY